MVFCFTVFAALASHSGSVQTAGAEARSFEAIAQTEVAVLFPCELSDVEVEETDDDERTPDVVPGSSEPVAAAFRALEGAWATQTDEALRVAISTGLCRGPPSLS